MTAKTYWISVRNWIFKCPNPSLYDQENMLGNHSPPETSSGQVAGELSPMGTSLIE